MASLRPGTRRDGSIYVQVLYRLDGKQSSTSFEDLTSAKKFQKLVDKLVMTLVINTSDVGSADGEEPKPIAAAGTLRVESRAMMVLQASAE
jgi:hypothetical protein